MSVGLSGCAAKTPPAEHVESAGHAQEATPSRADAEGVGTESLDDQIKSLIAENRITEGVSPIPKSIIALEAKETAYSALYIHVVEERPQRMDGRYIKDWLAAAGRNRSHRGSPSSWYVPECPGAISGTA